MKPEQTGLGIRVILDIRGSGLRASRLVRPLQHSLILLCQIPSVTAKGSAAKIEIVPFLDKGFDKGPERMI